MHTLRNSVALLALLLLVGGLLPARAQYSGPAPMAVAPPMVTSTIHVALTEYKITLDANTIPMGNVTFVITNNGAIPHSFSIRGTGFHQALTTALQPGQTVTVTYPSLTRGTYRIYDPTLGYARRGMRVMFMVRPVTTKGMPTGPARIQVSITNTSLLLNRFDVPRGTVVFNIVNNSNRRHSFAISGPGLTAALPHSLLPGDSFIFTVQGLHRGSYSLYDPMHNYASTGLMTTIHVGPWPTRNGM